MSNVLYAVSVGWPYATGVYMAPMPGDGEYLPYVTTTSAPRIDLSCADEAALVAEVLRRVLAGALMPRSRELLELALRRAEEM